MVFSEACNVAEELAKDGNHDAAESNVFHDTALSAEPENYSQDSWSSQPSNFPSDEFGYGAEEEPIVTGSNSPPLSLPSLRDPSPPAPAPPTQPVHEAETILAAEIIHDQPAVELVVLEKEIAPAPEPLSSATSAATTDVRTAEPDTDIVEQALATEKSDSVELVAESEKHDEEPLEAPLEPSPEACEAAAHVENPPAPAPEPARNDESPLQQEVSLNLCEPPPSEPVPPESESDITDEVHDADADEELREVERDL